MKKIIVPIIIAALMFAVGGFVAFRQMKSSNFLTSGQVLKKGSWVLPPKMDLSGSMMARAKIALTALFALRESEVFYAVAAEDEAGNPLEAGNTYKVTGKNFDTRYWSITLYGEDYFLIPNEQNIFNVNMYDVSYDQEGNFSFVISPKQQSGTWLPSSDTQSFDLLLRMYNPSEAIISDLENLELPIIKKIEN